MANMALPKSYNTLSLPDIKLSHHPASSPSPTPVVLVILDRPAARNAFTEDMMESLETAFNLLSADPRVHCVVLTGSDPTNRVFCAGADLDAGFRVQSARRPNPGGRATFRDGGGRVALAIYNCRKPVVAALNGSAVGVGITMTLPATIRVVSRKARVGFVFARRGLVMEACSSFFLPRLVGTSKAAHLVATGAVYPADHALLRDLFTEVVDDPAGVVPRALELAGEMARETSAVSAALMKDLLYRGGGSPEEAHLIESRLLFDLFQGRDCAEGVLSFMEKRPPRFEATLEKDAPQAWPWYGKDGEKLKPKI